MDWQTIVIIVLVAWAIYHTIFEAQQEKKLRDLERKISRSAD